jgi:hypothetical protein
LTQIFETNRDFVVIFVITQPAFIAPLSGSMFKGLLPTDINVYATTAANSTQSSYACYYDDYLLTFLGDVYSVMWLQGNVNDKIVKFGEQYQKKLAILHFQILTRKI